MRPSRSTSVPTYQRQEMDLIETTLIDIFPAKNMALLYPDDGPISWKGFLIFKRCRSAEPIENSVLPVPLVPNARAAQGCRASLFRLESRVRIPSPAPFFLAKTSATRQLSSPAAAGSGAGASRQNQQSGGKIHHPLDVRHLAY